MERPEGLRRDVLYAYDLELPEDLHARTRRMARSNPSPSGRWPASSQTVTETDDFKFNVNLVLIDLLIRFGLIEGDAAAQLRAALEQVRPGALPLDPAGAARPQTRLRYAIMTLNLASPFPQTQGQPASARSLNAILS